MMKCATSARSGTDGQQQPYSIAAAGAIKKIIFSGLLFLAVQYLAAQSLLPYVQPHAGTASSTTTAALKHSEAGSEKNANTIPAVGLPFGMTQWTPQTRQTENKCVPPYFYKDSLLSGFRGSHWLSGSCTQDYGSFTIMPVMGSLKTMVDDYAVSFSHANETSSPAYYKLDLPAQQLTTEMTATLRCGMMRFTAHRDDSLYLLVIPNSDKAMGFVQVDTAKGIIWGYNPAYRIYQGWGQPAGFSGWFYIQVEKHIGSSGVFSGAEILTGKSVRSRKDAGAFVGFRLKKNEQLNIRIGTSFSGMEKARANLYAETEAQSFDQVCSQTMQQWEKALGQVQVNTSNEKDKNIFYTAMYHAMQHPRLFSDADGTYPRFSNNYRLTHTAGNYYDDFSMWDIYRAQLPLLEILQPKKTNEFVQSLVMKGQEGRWLPIFPCWNNYTAAMIGDHVSAFIASAYAKGLRGFDVTAAYHLMRKNAFISAPAAEYAGGKSRRALTSYMKYGFIPLEDSVPMAFHKKEQVSRTLEYAFDDYAVAVVAKGLGKTSDYNLLRRRSLNYKNVFDTSVGMVRGRYADGSWVQPFRADARETYITEGTPRQYSFYVPQDVPGLAAIMGGPQKLEDGLDSLFAKNEYWHGNEPGHQIPFMYNYTAAPWKTQQAVAKIRAEEYTDGPGGLSGNDDAGQMSAWYIFAAMGFYPVNPVSDEYQLCTPLFDSISLHLQGGKQFRIVCRKKTDSAAYISAVWLNGKTYPRNFIRYKDIMKGGLLLIDLQAQPTGWGSGTGSRAQSAPGGSMKQIRSD